MKRGFLLLLFLLSGIGVVLAQNRTVKGVVIASNDNQPIIGASVVVVGQTTIGAATNIDGKFSFKVPSSAKSLKISFTGYKDKIVPISGSSMKIVLSEDAELLNDVVVTGYSKATKRSFVGTASVVNAKEISNKAVSNVSQALNGETPGVNIVNTNGQPGTEAKIYVRGVGSVNGSTAPLYVVDGIPYDGDITTINPNDIQSITLLKDAASTSIYGSRGANGVIVIQTKQGKRGTLKINVTQSFGVNTRFLPRYDVMCSPEEYIATTWQGLRQRGEDTNEADPVDYANKNLFLAPGQSGLGIPNLYNLWDVKTISELIDPTTGKVRGGVQRRYTPDEWAKYAFQSSLRSETNVSISGGDYKTQYFASAGYLKDKGYAVGSDYQRFTTRLSVNTNPTKWLNAGIILNYSLSKKIAVAQTEFSSTNIFTWVDDIPPIYPVFKRDATGNRIKDIKLGGYLFDWGDNGRPYSPGANGIGEAVLGRDFKVLGSTTVTAFANIKFLDHFTLENRVQGTRDDSKRVYLTSKYYGQDAQSGGVLGHTYIGTINVTGLNLLRYTNSFGKHDLEAFVAHEFTYLKYNKEDIFKKGLIFPYGYDFVNALDMQTPASGYTDTLALESYFGQVNYNYDNKYFASATLRRDGSSRFLNHKWGNFYSVGAAWMISSENFMNNVKWLRTLKLKASYGTLGSQGGISLYSGQDLYDMIPVGGKPSFVFSTKGNPDLTWEKSSMFQVGVEFDVNGRFDGSIDFYNKITHDMLFDVRVAPSNGYAILTTNDGKLLNRGVDFTFTGHILKDRHYFLDLSLNGGYLYNELLEMPIEKSTGKRKLIDVVSSFYSRTAGHSLYDFYMPTYEGVNTDTGEEMYKMLYVDANNDGKYTPGENIIRSVVQDLHNNPDYKGKIKSTTTTNTALATTNYVGKSSLPFLKGAFTVKGGLYGVNISLQFAYALGGYGYDSAYANYMSNGEPGKGNFHKDFEKRWVRKGQKTDIPKYNAGYTAEDSKNPVNTVSRGVSTRYLISSSFLSLNNVRLGYDLPKSWVKKMNLTAFNVWISGDNVALISARRGYNPTTSLVGGSSVYTYNPLTTFTAGVKLTF